MGRGHIPFGYRIKNGSAEIVPEEAEQIRKIYSAYIAGKPYIEAAKCAGLSMTHASVKWLLQNRHYIGDEFYPAIIDRHTFEQQKQSVFTGLISWEEHIEQGR